MDASRPRVPTYAILQAAVLSHSPRTLSGAPHPSRLSRGLSPGWAGTIGPALVLLALAAPPAMAGESSAPGAGFEPASGLFNRANRK